MAASRFLGPCAGGRASVGKATFGSGNRWLLRTNSSPASAPAPDPSTREGPSPPDRAPAPAAAIPIAARISRRVRHGSRLIRGPSRGEAIVIRRMARAVAALTRFGASGPVYLSTAGTARVAGPAHDS